MIERRKPLRRTGLKPPTSAQVRASQTKENPRKRRKVLVCPCGRRFERKLSEIAAGVNYCSRACHDLGKRGRSHDWRSSGAEPVEMTCPVCGATFKRYASQVRARGARWCSRKCQTIGQRKPRKPRACKHCGDLFEPRDERDPRRGRFCSRRCHDEWRNANRTKTLILTCTQCGTTFERPAAWVRRRHSDRHYCSRRCADRAKHRGQRLPNRGVVWRRLAETIRERDGYRCVRCGEPEPSTKSLNVDHIVPARLMLDVAPELVDDPANLASLCTACHAIKTHRYEPRILRGDFLALEEFYDRATRLRVTALIHPADAAIVGTLRPSDRRAIVTAVTPEAQ